MIQNVRVKLEVMDEIKSEVKVIRKPSDSVAILRQYLNDHCSTNRENVILLGLDVKFHPTVIHTLAVGSINNVMFSPDDLYKVLMLSNSTGFVIAHNHPTGDCTPSSYDVTFHKKLTKISSAVGFQFVDNIIFSDNDYFSFSENEASVASLKKA